MIRPIPHSYFCVLLSCLAIAVVPSPLQAQQASLVVSPDGPIATLEDARLKVQELKKEQPDQPIEVLIKSGVYRLQETVVFGLEDSGKDGAPVVYKASPGESPVFTGGVPITGWKKLVSEPAGVCNCLLYTSPSPRDS